MTMPKTTNQKQNQNKQIVDELADLKNRLKQATQNKSKKNKGAKDQRLVNNPVSYNMRQKTGKPNISRKADSCRVIHREYLADVLAPANYTNWNIVQTYSINPGLASTFPWLSAIANQFEMYKFHKLQFVYEASCPTSQAGKIEFCYDYDAADVAPNSQQAMLAFDGAEAVAPYDPKVVLAAKTSYMNRTMEKHYTRTRDIANTDVKTYDVAKFYLATISAVDALFGTLFVEYDVELFTPQLNTPPLSMSVQQQNFAMPLGAVPFLPNVTSMTSNVPSTMLNWTPGTLTWNNIPLGKYLLELQEQLGSLGNYWTPSNGINLTGMAGGTYSPLYDVEAPAASNVNQLGTEFLKYLINVQQPTGAIQLNASNAVANGVRSEVLNFTQLPKDYVPLL